MNWIDYGIIAFISIFSVIGLVRGSAAEAASLIVWIIAFGVGLGFSQELSIHFGSTISSASIKIAVSFTLLFLLTLLVGHLLKLVLRQLARSNRLGGADRFAGLLFGTGRGLLLVAIFVMIAGLTSLPRGSGWRESNLISSFQPIAVWLKKQSSFGIAGTIDYPR